MFVAVFYHTSIGILVAVFYLTGSTHAIQLYVQECFLLEQVVHFWVKVQFRGPELFKKKGALFQEESYLPRLFRSLSLNLYIFHLIHIVF